MTRVHSRRTSPPRLVYRGAVSGLGAVSHRCNHRCLAMRRVCRLCRPPRHRPSIPRHDHRHQPTAAPRRVRSDKATRLMRQPAAREAPGGARGSLASAVLHPPASLLWLRASLPSTVAAAVATVKVRRCGVSPPGSASLLNLHPHSNLTRLRCSPPVAKTARHHRPCGLSVRAAAPAAAAPRTMCRPLSLALCCLHPRPVTARRALTALGV